MNKVRKLIKELQIASNAYYNTSTPIMSDEEYDFKLKELENFEKESGLIYFDSPTQTVGSTVLSNLNKITIEPVPMLSLAKVHGAEEVFNFAGKHDMVAMLKCDGLSVRIIYENGKLKSANSRGNGTIGSDITEHIKQFINVPKFIPTKEFVVVDGEAIIKENDFKDINKNGEFKNPRNTAAGTLNSLDTSVVKNRKLSFIAWDLIENKENHMFDRLTLLSSWGFEVVPSILLLGEEINLENIQDAHNFLRNFSFIPNDGIVWKYDDIAFGKSLGRTNHHFNFAIAWKPEVEKYDTKLLDIEWSMGRRGQLCPVAVFEPVDDGESIIERASLHNLSIMENILGKPYKNEPITIYKANLIIPQVLCAEKDPKVLQFKNEENITVLSIKIPDVCPICGAKLIIKQDNDSKILFCSNEQCEGKFLNQLDHFCGKKGLDIKGLSKSTLEKLMNWGWLNELSDIFILSKWRNEWIKQTGFGIKSVDNILQAIEDSKTCSLESFISALGIPLIGLNVAKELIKHVSSYADFRTKIEERWDFTQINGFGENKTYSLLNFNYSQADKISKILTFEQPKEKKVKDTLNGVTVVITGRLTTFKNRAELQSAIETHGGKVVNSVSKKTTYLINNDLGSESAKNQTARKLGIPILSEETFKQKFLT